MLSTFFFQDKKFSESDTTRQGIVMTHQTRKKKKSSLLEAIASHCLLNIHPPLIFHIGTKMRFSFAREKTLDFEGFIHFLPFHSFFSPTLFSSFITYCSCGMYFTHKASQLILLRRACNTNVSGMSPVNRKKYFVCLRAVSQKDIFLCLY